MTILAALDDPNLLGAAFPEPAAWAAWRTFLTAAFGLPMTGEQVDIYHRHTGRETPPTAQAKEAWAICGRRAGKSRIAAALATFLACFRTYRLAPGESGVLMVIACDKAQAKVVFGYVRALLAATPMLAAMVVGETAETIELSNRIRIEVRAGNYRSVRGVTLIGCVLDEVAFLRDETSATPDIELYRALKPAMATVDGMLVGISTPYSQHGLLWNKYRRHFGKDCDTLIWVAPSLAMNPSLPAEIIEQALADDEPAARAEWLAEFRSDLEAFVSPDAVHAVVVPGRYELPPLAGTSYLGFCDPSGGSSDSMTLALAHGEQRDGRQAAVLDVVRERRPPFSPEQVVTDFAQVLASYGVSSVTGDRYAGEWPREQFRKRGIAYEPSAQAKSDIYLGFLPALNSGRVELLDHPRLVAQLLALERRTSRGGRDSIDHAPGGHDDLANAAAGALVAAGQPGECVIGFANLAPEAQRLALGGEVTTYAHEQLWLEREAAERERATLANEWQRFRQRGF